MIYYATEFTIEVLAAIVAGLALLVASEIILSINGFRISKRFRGKDNFLSAVKINAQVSTSNAKAHNDHPDDELINELKQVVRTLKININSLYEQYGSTQWYDKLDIIFILLSILLSMVSLALPYLLSTTFTKQTWADTTLILVIVFMAYISYRLYNAYNEYRIRKTHAINLIKEGERELSSATNLLKHYERGTHG